jgi:DNA-directed RNA polymerase delta subunit
MNFCKPFSILIKSYKGVIEYYFMQVHNIKWKLESVLQVDREEEEKPDVRQTQTDKDKRVAANNEFSDSEDEGDRKDQKSHKGKKPRLDKPEAKVKAEEKPTEETKDNGELIYYSVEYFLLLRSICYHKKIFIYNLAIE